MANDFSGDSNCVALYRFENDVTDSKGNNDLTNSGVSFSATAKEGSYSGNFEASEADYAEISNANLDSGFPGKSGESFIALSNAVWVRLESSADEVICGVWNATANARCWAVKYEVTGTFFQFFKGYNAGASYEQLDHGYTSVALATWYHLQISYLESSKALLFGVWDDAYAGYRQVDSQDFDGTTFAQATNVEDEEFNVGRYGQSLYYFDGLLDELVIFKDVVSASEFAAIRAGTYGAINLAVADLAHGHSLDNAALTQANTLTVADLAHGHSLDNVTLGLAITLAVADLAHGHSLDNVALTQANTLAVNDLAHGHSLDNTALTQANTLTVADLAHGHSLDNVTLGLAITLVVADLTHGHSLDNVALTQANTLAVNDLAHSHAIDNVALTGFYVLDSSFECGNGIADSPFQVGDTLNIVTECDPSPAATSWGDWFYFKLTGVNGQSPTINVDFNNDRGGGPMWTTHGDVHPVYSYDQVTWTRITPTGYASEILTFDLPVMTQNTVYVAMDIPYSYSNLQADIATWDASPYCSASILSFGGISTSQGGRNVYYLKIEEEGYYQNRLELVITGRSHPGEPQSSWHLKGMIDWVLSDDPDAVEFRRKSILYIFPMTNPDGVHAGRFRSYNDGSDANRGFDAVNGPSSSTEPDETFLIHSQIDLINANVTVAIDSHANNYASPRWVYDSSHDDWTADERNAIVSDLNTNDTVDYWYDGMQDMIAADTTGWRCGQITQYGYHALGIEGGIYDDAAGVYPTSAQRVAGGGVLLESLIQTREETYILLAVADLVHGHSLDNVALIQANTLAVGDLLHVHSLDNISLSTALTLAVADLLHGHALDNVALTQAHTLAVADLAHGHSLDNVTLSTAIMLIVADLAHAHSLDSMALTQAHTLAVADLAHGHILDNVLLLLLDSTPLITFTGKAGVFEFTGKTGTFTFTAK